MPEHLSKIWRIPFDDTVKTLAMTTQLIQQSPNSTLSRSAGTNDRAVRYRKLKSKFFTDTMFATKKARSLRGNTCCQVFVSDCDFLSLYPMQQESEYPLALKQFAKESSCYVPRWGQRLRPLRLNLSGQIELNLRL